MENKSIDINQRIPLDTLHVALDSYLSSNYNNAYIIEQLKLEFEGENRLKKALRIVNKIIVKSPLSDFIQEHNKEINNAIKKRDDRNIILIALLNSAFPFSFDVLKVIGKYFSVQDVINSETIKKPISNKYGGNRATENAIYSVVPMFLEAGLFSRPKQGVYEMNAKLKVSSLIAKKIFIESYKINMKIDLIQDYQLNDPYFLFVND